MMKNICLTIPYITLITIVHSAAAAQKLPVAKKIDTTHEKTIVKNYSYTVTENDYNFYEIGRFDTYVKKHIKTIAGVNGIVELGFTNQKDGSITNVKIVKGLNTAANNEAIRLLKQFGKWKPNTIGGKPQSSTGTITIPFGKSRKQ